MTDKNQAEFVPCWICRFYRDNNWRYDIASTGCSYDHPQPCPKLLQFWYDTSWEWNFGKKCPTCHPRLSRNSKNLQKQPVQIHTPERYSHRKWTYTGPGEKEEPKGQHNKPERAVKENSQPAKQTSSEDSNTYFLHLIQDFISDLARKNLGSACRNKELISGHEHVAK